MPLTPARKQATDRYRAKNGRAQINIELTPETRQRWQAYAQARGMSLTAVVRECVARCMAEDSFAPEHAGEGRSDADTVSVAAPSAAVAPPPARPVRAQRGIEGLEGMD